MIEYDFTIRQASVADRQGREWEVGARMKVNNITNTSTLPALNKRELRKLADTINEFLKSE